MTIPVGAYGPGWSWSTSRLVALAAALGIGAAWTAYAALAPDLRFGGDQELRQTAAALSIEHEAFTAALGLVEARTSEIAQGELLPDLLRRLGAEHEEARAVTQVLGGFVDVADLASGMAISAYFVRGGGRPKLTGVSFRSEPGTVISVNLAHDGLFRARPIIMPRIFDVAAATGQVETSLYEALVGAGLGEREVQAFADVFAFDIDFQRDIFPGDRFEIVFERFRDDAGQTVRTGETLFVSLQTRSGVKNYYRYKAPGGDAEWYDPEGRTARKFLMKTPINGARLSSGFGMRTHPVLGFSRMHRGVDFAAPIGTPIMAAGDGVVEKVGWGGGLGRMVQLRHADGYETVYGHMSNFARGLSPGETVRQGQLIGYVGSTGLSTGPHLHYEVIHRGEHINPMSMRVPTGRNIETAFMAQFQAERARIDALRRGERASPSAVNAVTQASQPTADGLRGAIE
jgi:murein DD-endopeptidase MepM/ murein hydrolase activator NlpD